MSPSCIIGRLNERLTFATDKERALCLADDQNEVEVATRAGMPMGPSTLQAIGSHPDERISSKVWVCITRQQLGLPLLPSSNYLMGRSDDEDSCLVCGENLDVHGRHARSSPGRELLASIPGSSLLTFATPLSGFAATAITAD